MCKSEMIGIPENLLVSSFACSTSANLLISYPDRCGYMASPFPGSCILISNDPDTRECASDDVLIIRLGADRFRRSSSK